MWAGLNAYSKEMLFELPKSISKWQVVLDTACPSFQTNPIEVETSNQASIRLEARSLVVMIANEYASKIQA